jgi:MFS family permease
MMAVLTLMGVACLTIMVGCVIVPGLPAIAPKLGWGAQAGWLVTLPSLGVVLFGPLAGKCIESMGPRRALLAGLTLYGALGLAAIGLRGNAVLVDRLLLGAATSVVMSSGTMLLTSLYTGPARMKIIALQGMSIELGGVVFLSMGGWLMQFGWSAPFGLYGVAWVLALLFFLFVPRGGASARPFKSAGAGKQGTFSDSDEGMPGRSSQAGEVDPEMAHSLEAKVMGRGNAGKSLRVVYAAALCSMAIFFTAVVGLPFRLGVATEQGGPGFTEAQVGYYLSAVSLVAVLAASQMPRVVRAIRELRTLMVAFICYAIAHVVLSLSGTALLPWLCAVLFMGTGFGLSVPLVNHLTVEWSPANRRGRLLAYLSMCLFMGQFLAAFTNLLPGGPNAGFVAAAALGGLAAVGTAWASFKQVA